MSSVKKPPLPVGSIIGKRPDLYCINWKQTQKKCEEFGAHKRLKKIWRTT